MPRKADSCVRAPQSLVVITVLILVVSSCSSTQPSSARTPAADDEIAFENLIENFESDKTLRFPLIGFDADFDGVRQSPGFWKLEEGSAEAQYTQTWSISTIRDACSECPTNATAVMVSQIHHNRIDDRANVELTSSDTIPLGDGLEYWLPPQQTTLDLSERGRHCVIVNASAQIRFEDKTIASADIDQVVLIDVGASTPQHCDVASTADQSQIWTELSQGESFGCGFGRFLPTDDPVVKVAEINGCQTDQLLVAVPVDVTGRVLPCCFLPILRARSLPQTVYSAPVTFADEGRWRTMLLPDLDAFSVTAPDQPIWPIIWPNTDPPAP